MYCRYILFLPVSLLGYSEFCADIWHEAGSQTVEMMKRDTGPLRVAWDLALTITHRPLLQDLHK
jgi:hypothetical protein